MSSSHFSHSRRRTQSTGPTDVSSATKRSSAYDTDFEQHLNDYNIYLPDHEFSDNHPFPEPANLDECHSILSKRRPSLSSVHFTHNDFVNFRDNARKSRTESSTMRNIIPTLLGSSNIPSESNVPFSFLESMTNNATVKPVPDFFDGALFGSLHKKVREDIGDLVLPTKRASDPIAPNFFLELKGRGGDVDVCERQACYYGAHGARAMHALQNYGQGDAEKIYDEHVYAYSSTYQKGLLRMYGHHVSAPTTADEDPKYHITNIRSYYMMNNRESFVTGATAIRNIREWAKRLRDRFIEAANAKAAFMIRQISNDGRESVDRAWRGAPESSDPSLREARESSSRSQRDARESSSRSQEDARESLSRSQRDARESSSRSLREARDSMERSQRDAWQYEDDAFQQQAADSSYAAQPRAAHSNYSPPRDSVDRSQRDALQYEDDAFQQQPADSSYDAQPRVAYSNYSPPRDSVDRSQRDALQYEDDAFQQQPADSSYDARPRVAYNNYSLPRDSEASPVAQYDEAQDGSQNAAAGYAASSTSLNTDQRRAKRNRQSSGPSSPMASASQPAKSRARSSPSSWSRQSSSSAAEPAQSSPGKDHWVTTYKRSGKVCFRDPEGRKFRTEVEDWTHQTQPRCFYWRDVEWDRVFRTLELPTEAWE